MSSLAERFDDAQQNARAIDPPVETRTMTTADAYLAQHELLARRLNRGERPVGIKLGFTSKAKMQQMGLHESIAGQLTDSMRVEDRSAIELAGLIAPRVEPEIAFRLAREFDPADVDDIVFAVDAVAPALDVIDSRVRDYAFDHGAVVADNASAGAFAVGNWTPLDSATAACVSNLAVTMYADGRPREFGSTAAILGHPMRALLALHRIAGAHGLVLRAGDIILAGAATASIALVPGYYEARLPMLGSVGIEASHG